MRSVVALLQNPVTRLVRITASEGTGETRLALQASARIVPELPDGAFLVSLADPGDPQRFIYFTASALRFGFCRSQAPERQILDFL